MKIRIKSNSLRYRLTKSDMAKLASAGCLEDQIGFGVAKLKYILKSTKDSELSADYGNDTITLFMPESMIEEWNNTDRVGFEHQTGDLYLLVEKDFTCLDNVAEDQSDNYPNPLAAKLV